MKFKNLIIYIKSIVYARSLENFCLYDYPPVTPHAVLAKNASLSLDKNTNDKGSKANVN